MKQKEIEGQKQKKWYQQMPHIFVLLFGLIVLAAVLTWIVPAGKFERAPIEGSYAQGIIPGTYRTVEQNPAGVMDIFKSLIQGLNASSGVVFMILIASGVFSVITSTSALENGLGMFLNRVHKAKIPPIIVVWVVTFLFSAFGIMVGPEIQIPFTVISVSIALGLGYDPIVGLAMIVGGGYVGFAAAPINPSTVGTAQIIGELPYYSGVGLRWVFWIVCTAATCVFITFYANRVKKDPSTSYVKDMDTAGLGFSRSLNEYTLSKRQIVILFVFIALFFCFVVGPTEFGWYLEEISACLIIAGLVSGWVYGYKTNQMIDIFLKGASGMVMPAFTVGLGRAIQIVLDQGNVMDTIVNYVSMPLVDFGKYTAGIVIVFIQMIINFFIPSGSGQAAAVMPIMFPVGDMIGLTRQCSVLAFQIGDGFSNLCIPTLGAVVAMCGLAKVPFEKWFRFAVKLVAVLMLIGIAFLMYAISTNYGPF